MQTQSGKRIDNYWNRYDAGKKYMELLFRDGYGTQASEMNELQSLFAARVKSLADSLFKDGDILQDAQITVNVQTGRSRRKPVWCTCPGLCGRWRPRPLSFPCKVRFPWACGSGKASYPNWKTRRCATPPWAAVARGNLGHGERRWRPYGGMTETAVPGSSTPSIRLTTGCRAPRKLRRTWTVSTRGSRGMTAIPRAAGPTSAPA